MISTFSPTYTNWNWPFYTNQTTNSTAYYDNGPQYDYYRPPPRRAYVDEQLEQLHRDIEKFGKDVAKYRMMSIHRRRLSALLVDERPQGLPRPAVLLSPPPRPSPVLLTRSRGQAPRPMRRSR